MGAWLSGSNPSESQLPSKLAYTKLMSTLALAPALLHLFTEINTCLKMKTNEHMGVPGPVFLKSERRQIMSASRLIVHSIPSSHCLGFFFCLQLKACCERLWYQLPMLASSLTISSLLPASSTHLRFKIRLISKRRVIDSMTYIWSISTFPKTTLERFMVYLLDST